MSENLSDILREDLAWESFIMLRNTNTMSVLISVQDVLCVRGYWNAPEDASKHVILDWFVRQIQRIGLSDLRNELYFPQSTDELWPILPRGTTTVLLQPISGISDQNYSETEKLNGFILLVSSASYAYSDKDREWTKAIARKFHVHFS